MGIAWNDISTNALGGTELLCKRLEASLSPELLDSVQITPSRELIPLDPEKIRIFWAHDLADDPEAAKALGNRRWERFHRIVFVSNWQMQAYITKFDIPWSKCIVIPNSILPIDQSSSLRTKDEPIRFIYHTTPHRGLNILVAVFEQLAKKYDNIHLDVYSSFQIYGWGERDEQFRDLFDAIDSHPQMTNHGTISNAGIREALSNSDIFAYPCTWHETSCLSLIEAMSAGLMCIHSNLGALYETSASWTTMYQYQENPNEHASLLYQITDGVLSDFGSELQQSQIRSQRDYANIFHNWNFRKPQWEALIQSLQTMPREMPEPSFVYRT